MLWQLLLIVIVSTFSVNNHAHPPYTGQKWWMSFTNYEYISFGGALLEFKFCRWASSALSNTIWSKLTLTGFISCAKKQIGKIFLSLVQPYLCTHEVWSLYVKLKFVWRRKRFVRRFLLWGQPVCLKFCVCGANPAEDYNMCITRLD